MRSNYDLDALRSHASPIHAILELILPDLGQGLIFTEINRGQVLAPPENLHELVHALVPDSVAS